MIAGARTTAAILAAAILLRIPGLFTDFWLDEIWALRTMENVHAVSAIFTGIHRDTFFGVAATGKPVRWAGAAFFTGDRGQITRLWVLGDIDAVKQQLGAPTASAFG